MIDNIGFPGVQVPPGEGFDHNFCVVRRSQPELMFVARVLHPNSGR